MLFKYQPNIEQIPCKKKYKSHANIAYHLKITFNYCKNILQVLSKHCPNIVQIKSKYCANIVQILCKCCNRYSAKVLGIYYKYCENIVQIFGI